MPCAELTVLFGGVIRYTARLEEERVATRVAAEALHKKLRAEAVRPPCTLLAPPPTQRYATGAVIEGVSGELR